MTDDIRDYFRMWSAPVHRWLSACVNRPMRDAARSWRTGLPRGCKQPRMLKSESNSSPAPRA